MRKILIILVALASFTVGVLIVATVGYLLNLPPMAVGCLGFIIGMTTYIFAFMAWIDK